MANDLKQVMRVENNGIAAEQMSPENGKKIFDMREELFKNYEPCQEST